MGIEFHNTVALTFGYLHLTFEDMEFMVSVVKGVIGSVETSIAFRQDKIDELPLSSIVGDACQVREILMTAHR